MFEKLYWECFISWDEINTFEKQERKEILDLFEHFFSSCWYIHTEVKLRREIYLYKEKHFNLLILLEKRESHTS